MSIKNANRDPLLSNAHRLIEEYGLGRHISLLTNNRNEAKSNALPGMIGYSIWNEDEDAQQIAAADRHQLHKLEPTTFPFAPAAGLCVSSSEQSGMTSRRYR